MILLNCGNPPPRGKVRYKILNHSPYIPTFLQGVRESPIDKCISFSQIRYIFCQQEIYIYVWPINSFFLLLKVKIFSGNPKNFLGPMVSWSDTFSIPAKQLLAHSALFLKCLCNEIFDLIFFPALMNHLVLNILQKTESKFN